MKFKFPLPRTALLASVLLPLMTSAHPGHGLSQSPAPDSFQILWAGINHPFTGIDHLLAMLAVGMWSAQLGGRLRWAMPLCFALMLGLGSVLGINGAAVGVVEQMVTASVLVFGLLAATALRMSPLTALLLAGSFALFHGYAHGAEMQSSFAGSAYVLGLVLSSTVLQAVGRGWMNWIVRRAPQAAPASGLLIAASGVLLCVGAFA